MRKTASMTLKDGRGKMVVEGKEFKLLKIKNSTEFIPGDWIGKKDVDNKIRLGWDITILPWSTK